MKKVLILKGFYDAEKVDETEYLRGEEVELSDARAAELEKKEFVKILGDGSKDS